MQALVGIFRDRRRPPARRSTGWPSCGPASRPAASPAVVRSTPAGTSSSSWRNLLTISEAITRSALQRTESRGAHSRLDFPDADDTRWGLLNSVVSRAPDGSMSIATTPLPAISDELRGLLGAAH